MVGSLLQILTAYLRPATDPLTWPLKVYLENVSQRTNTQCVYRLVSCKIFPSKKLFVHQTTSKHASKFIKHDQTTNKYTTTLRAIVGSLLSKWMCYLKVPRVE